MSRNDEPKMHETAVPERPLSRKTLLKAVTVAGAAPLLFGAGTALARDRRGTGSAPELTPDCDDGDEPTVPQTEGPYFKPNSPLRTSLVTAGTPGIRLTVSGYVFGSACLPIANVLLDFWQADDNGAYDNTGFTFRGHQFTNTQGAFTLSTIVPGLYPGRTRHIHVKAQAPGRPVLTTQLYFPGEPRNNTDTIFDARLLMNVRQIESGREGTFDFVLNVPQTPTPTPTSSSSPTATPTGGSWAPGTAYRPGDRVSYGGASYQCLQGHTSMVGWEPPNVPALWRRL
ncbi:dioxygenase [Kitasatospora sp. CMC57]|uniref:Dioxygenase n=1 Tax=Kitasatospora sp. CMC57 TaxID=3231513 RepID=A0AB33K5W6_9ACTN